MNIPVKCYVMMILAAGLVYSSGCFSAARSDRQSLSVPVRVVYESHFCGGVASEAKAVLINSEEALLRANITGERAPIDSDQRLSALVDFKSDLVVLVSMGQQPTGGYRVSLGQAHAVVVGEAAQITLKWIRPSADDMVSQVITEPCILLSLPKGGYSRIEVINQHGRRLFVTELGEP